jgi:cyclohexanone monooxygenase
MAKDVTLPGESARELREFDPDELREKYRREREKRLRPDGEAQYVPLTEKFAHYANSDPWTHVITPREPLRDEIDVAIIGGGFSGMVTAVRLLKRGLDRIRIIDAAADFGGTWYWNRYPGAQCDIESYLYLPLLEETGYIPKEKYSYAPEIFSHAQRIGKMFNLYDVACFQTKVTGLSWDAEAARWLVSTNREDRIRARFVVVAPGILNRPKLPGIPGIEDFEGHSFHTSRWDYDYTGGDQNGNLHGLEDKRVAIIGTGATAVQCVPHLGRYAKHLYVFQRTPSSVGRRGNSPTDPEWVQTLRPGWQRVRRENFNDVLIGQPVEVDMVNDGWTVLFKNLERVMPLGGAPASTKEMEALAELADFETMNQIRARVDELVRDPRTAEALKPWHRLFCKRPTFNDEYLPTFNRPNVTLIDTSGSRGVERITRTGVVASGVEYEVDCIIFASGFEVGSTRHRGLDFNILGPDGYSLFEHWARGIRTLHGHSTFGFPNLFFIGVGQNGLSANMTFMLETQAEHIAYILDEVMRRGARSVQPTSEAESAWVSEIRSGALYSKAFFESCTPGFYNNEGHYGDGVGSLIGESYALGLNQFNVLLEEWRERGMLDGLDLT